jgi:hypothetical protein
MEKGGRREAVKIGSKIGKGLKLDVYLSASDLWLVGEIGKRVDAVKDLGYRTSFNFELVKLLKLAVKFAPSEWGRP